MPSYTSTTKKDTDWKDPLSFSKEQLQNMEEHELSKISKDLENYAWKKRYPTVQAMSTVGLCGIFSFALTAGSGFLVDKNLGPQSIKDQEATNHAFALSAPENVKNFRVFVKDSKTGAFTILERVAEEAPSVDGYLYVELTPKDAEQAVKDEISYFRPSMALYHNANKDPENAGLHACTDNMRYTAPDIPQVFSISKPFLTENKVGRSISDRDQTPFPFSLSILKDSANTPFSLSERMSTLSSVKEAKITKDKKLEQKKDAPSRLSHFFASQAHDSPRAWQFFLAIGSFVGQLGGLAFLTTKKEDKAANKFQEEILNPVLKERGIELS